MIVIWLYNFNNMATYSCTYMCQCMYDCGGECVYEYIHTNTPIFLYNLYIQPYVCLFANSVCACVCVRESTRTCRCFWMCKCNLMCIRRYINTFQAYHVTSSCTQACRGKPGRLPFDQSRHESEAGNNFVWCADREL